MADFFETPDSASRLFNSGQFTQWRKNGFGPEYVNTMVRNSLATARGEYVQAANNIEANIAGSGLEFSGIRGKAHAYSIADLASVANKARTEAWANNEELKGQMAQSELQVAMHQDDMNLQAEIARRELEERQGGWFDRVLQGGSLLAAFI